MLAWVLAIALSQTLTPGVIRPLTPAQVCGTRWGLDHRHVTLAMRQAVFRSYQIPWSQYARYEVDHLVPRELGGSDDVRNLWPQPWTGPWNAHEKDRLENRLHRDVCAGRLSLVEAQRRIREDWQALFTETYGP